MAILRYILRVVVVGGLLYLMYAALMNRALLATLHGGVIVLFVIAFGVSSTLEDAAAARSRRAKEKKSVSH